MKLQHRNSGSVLWIETLDGYRPIAYIAFAEYKPGTIVSGYTYVDPAFRGQGLADAMYLYAHKLGYNIKESVLQSPQGARMWKRFRKNKLPFAKETLFEKVKRIVGV